MEDPLQQSYSNIAPSLSFAEIDQLFKMDYSAVSQTAKRFEQESKVNQKLREIKQKMIAALRENLNVKCSKALSINFRLLNLP